MEKGYAQGYVPTVNNGNAEFVLPLKSSDTGITSITVTPVIGTDDATPFAYGNYEFNVSPDANGVFLISLALPLKASRINGTYPVTFIARYKDSAAKACSQEFSVYLTIADGKDPNAKDNTSKAVAGQLNIDSDTLYNGMAKTYAKGYMPLVQNGMVYIILPLLGETYNGKVTVTADLGATAGSPFVYGNYTQTLHGPNGYLFAFEIPLAQARYNGSYPVVLKADYLDTTGEKAQQSFTVYVAITDGKTPPDPNAVKKEAAEKPELFISACKTDPETVDGEEEFTVTIKVENIGNIRARNVRLTYGGSDTSSAEADTPSGIEPVDTNNSIHLDNISEGKSVTETFKLRTTKDILAGSQPFSITLDYTDLYGGVYTSTRAFLVKVAREAEISYDPITVPKEVTAGETMSLPANVFNTGKSTLRNVTITVTGAGMFPTSSVFLGDIQPGHVGNGEMKVCIGMLSMTEGYNENYGKTQGKYTITYEDDAEEKHTIDLDFSTEIKKPVIDTSADAKAKAIQQPVMQWWIAVLTCFAIIAIVIAVIVVAKFTRMFKMR
jgi:hypothetical protein